MCNVIQNLLILKIDKIFCEILSEKHEFLFQLNYSILKLLLKLFDINTPIRCSSEFNFKKIKNLIEFFDLTIKTNATYFLFGEQGSNYADNKKFSDNNVKIFFQKYNHPVYDQFNSNDFIHKLIYVVLLFNNVKENKKIFLYKKLKKKKLFKLRK